MDADSIIFLVDDKQEIRRLIADILRTLKRQKRITFGKLWEFSDTPRALSHLSAELLTRDPETQTDGVDQKVITKNLIICDVEIPGNNGLWLVRNVREQPLLRSLPFLMLSDYPDVGTIAELGEWGVTDILVKPFSQLQMETAIFNMISRMNDPEETLYQTVERKIEEADYAAALSLIKNGSARLTASYRWLLLQGRALLGLEQLSEAERYLSAVSQCDVHVLQTLGLKHLLSLYQKTGDTQRTVSILELLNQKNPSNLSRKVTLAELLFTVNRKEQAKGILAEVAKAPNVQLELQLKAAILFEENGFSEEAAKIHVRVIRRNLDDPVLANDVAIRLRKNKRYNEAETCYSSIIRVHPSNPLVWYNRGINYASWSSTTIRGRERDYYRDKAQECLEKAIRLKGGDFPEATEVMEKVKTL